MYEVGDKVRVKDDLICMEYDDECFFDPAMLKYKGKEFKIVKKTCEHGVGDRYKLDGVQLDGINWNFSSSMLEPIKKLGGKDMKNEYLKAGRTVLFENGKLGKVLHDVDTTYYGKQDIFIAVQGGGFKTGDKYDEHLTKEADPEYNIVEVFEKPNEAIILNFDTKDSLWKRPEPKKLTVAEVEKLLGYKVEIISE